jgi:4-carboxymuconolactone decarboxylase
MILFRVEHRRFIGAEGAAVTGPRQLIGDFAPKLVSLTDDVLFGDIWEREELSKRDRSLITVAALVAGGNTEQLPGHELKELIIHLAFYAGWPKAMSAITVAKRLFEAEQKLGAAVRLAAPSGLVRTAELIRPAPTTVHPDPRRCCLRPAVQSPQLSVTAGPGRSARPPMNPLNTTLGTGPPRMDPATRAGAGRRCR